MKIIWENYDSSFDEVVESYMNDNDRKMLCMEEKSWAQTAKDIEENVLLGKNGQFRNVVGFYNDKPVVFMMFGVEFSGRDLRIYNLLVSPKFRHNGLAKQAIKDVLDERNIFGFQKTYERVVTSIYPENLPSRCAFMDVGFEKSNLYDGFLDMSKSL